LESGHVCQACLTRIGDELSEILTLAANASVEPISGRGQGRSVPSSRPPINVDGVDPALTMVTDCATVLDICEAWERLVREARGMAPYGPTSHARAIAAHARQNDTVVTLSGCTSFLRASLPWWADSPDQPLEDFAGEIHACRRALAKWDPMRDDAGTMVKCPTLTDQGECGYRLRYLDADEVVQCRRCGVTRDAMTLITVALADGDAAVWVDPEAASRESGVSQAVLKRWASRGLLHVSHGLYDLRAVHRTMIQQREAGSLALLRRVL
jgi:hypothetical protein